MLPASVRAISRCLVGLQTAGYFRVTSIRRTATFVTMATGGETIMVTGGAGFLGQHIVKLLQERGDNLKEIRVFDKKPYVNILGHAEDIPMWSIVGDLCSPDEVATAFRGVNSVYHVAGLVSFGTFPDLRGMENVNVNGTQNVIEACLKQHVSRLVFCSTVDVVIGFDEIHDGNETTTTKPDTFLFPGYPDTKYRAELRILEANGKQHSDGKRLQSLSLRPNVMYGEGDPYFVVNPLMTAKKSGGKLYRVGNGEALFQQAYAGNVAWAFIMADRALKTRPETVGGQTFFVPDDTPTQSVFDFLEPFLCARGYRLSSFRIPYWFLYGLLYITETLLWIISPLIKINMKTPLCSIMYTNMTLYFNRSKAETLLGYKPIFTPEESMERSLKYYKDAEL